ncbi:MAG: hypothetical protein K0Q91_1190 [Fibrobacteria bacterium]|nr:hypothetical protein [Fibrobacteria bacterium]
MLMDDSGTNPTKTGYVRLKLELGQNPTALLKSSSADTTFTLDSLLIVLTAPGQAAQTHRYALTGRADLEDIAVPEMTFELAGLREWTAKFISIDTSESPARRDTVHLDSVKFDVVMADTTVVNWTVSPAYSILRVRFWSTMADSIPNNVVYLRVRVAGVTRDSVVLGGKNASLKWLQTMPGSVIYAVGDSGRFLRSTNDAQTSDASAWEERVLGLHSLSGGCFPSLAVGYVFSAPGQTYHTDDSGKTFTTRYLQPDSINACYFRELSTGFTVGQRGGIYKTENNGNSFFTLTSNTPHHLNAIAFPTTDVGYVVGENETILKTVNGTAPGGAPAEFGGIVWSPVAGGWFVQTSNTSNHIRDVQFITQDTGWVVGAGDYLRVTYDGGAVWSSRDIGGLNPNAITFTAPTRGWIASDGGGIRTFISQYDWRTVTSGTTANLYDIRGVGNDTVYAVGANGTIRRTTNAGNVPANPHLVTWAGQTLPAPEAGWNAKSNLNSSSLRALHFADANNGWAVGASGVIRASADGGESWSGQASPTSHQLNAVKFTSATAGAAVGAGETIVRTTDGGANWLHYPGGFFAQSSGVSDSLNSVSFGSHAVGFGVGAAGRILKTSDRGETWTASVSGANRLNGVYARNASNAHAVGIGTNGGANANMRRTTNGGDTWAEITSGVATELRGVWVNAAGDRFYAVGAGGRLLRSQTGLSGSWSAQSIGGTTQTLNAIHSNNSRVWAVGDSGVIRLRTATSAGAFTAINSAGTTQKLNGVWCQSNTNAVIVGDGGLILRTTNTGTGWTSLGSAGLTTENLHHVYFRGTSDTGFIVGANGTILRTVNGTTWTKMTSGTGEALRGVYLSATSQDTVYAVGSGGAIRKTVTGGNWSGRTNSQILRGVTWHSSTVGFAAGDSGVILRTTNGGLGWRPVASGITDSLYGIFSNGSSLWAVGKGGVLRRSTAPTTTTPTFTSPATGTTERLNAVHFTSNSVGYIVGNNGLIRKTIVSGNNTWTTQGGPSLTTEHLVYVHFKGNGASNGANDTGFAVGVNGTILRTTNGGTVWTRDSTYTGTSLNGVHAITGNIVLAAGDDGKVLKNPGNSPNTSTLRSIHPVTPSLVYTVGTGGTIAKTTNGGDDWVLQTSNTSQTLNGVSFLNAGTGYAVGNAGVILKTVDGGANWVAQASNTSQNLLAVQILSNDTVYVTGASGVILKTVNGGAVWYTQETPNTNALNSVYFLNRDVGYAVGNNGTILNAVNQGDNWTGGGIKRSLKSVYFINADTGWIVGADAVILKTVNGGTTWIEQHREEGVTLYGIYFVDALTGWAVGENGTVLKTSNGGASWNAQSSGTSITLRSVNFRDVNRGFILGGTESILETSNGGSNWGGLFVGVPGERTFDRLLSTKYLKSGQTQQVIIEAMDRFSLPLRGYQSTVTLNAGAGQDSTIVSPMSRCGYGPPTPDCAP